MHRSMLTERQSVSIKEVKVLRTGPDPGACHPQKERAVVKEQIPKQPSQGYFLSRVLRQAIVGNYARIPPRYLSKKRAYIRNPQVARGLSFREYLHTWAPYGTTKFGARVVQRGGNSEGKSRVPRYSRQPRPIPPTTTPGWHHSSRPGARPADGPPCLASVSQLDNTSVFGLIRYRRPSAQVQHASPRPSQHQDARRMSLDSEPAATGHVDHSSNPGTTPTGTRGKPAREPAVARARHLGHLMPV